MAPVFALMSIAGAALSTVLLWPIMGIAALFAAPFVASFGTFAAAIALARRERRSAPKLPEGQTDKMVAELRAALDASRRSDVLRVAEKRVRKA